MIGCAAQNTDTMDGACKARVEVSVLIPAWIGLCPQPIVKSTGLLQLLVAPLLPTARTQKR